jgi:hypothetical protein
MADLGILCMTPREGWVNLEGGENPLLWIRPLSSSRPEMYVTCKKLEKMVIYSPILPKSLIFESQLSRVLSTR